MKESLRIEFYDETANNIEKRLNLIIRSQIYNSFYLPKLLEWEIFKDAKNILEVGVGSGDKLSKTKKVLDDEVEVLGIDASSAMLDVGISKYPELENILQEGNAFDLKNIENKSQDVMMYYQILHHFEPAELKQIIDTAYQKLKPEGKLVIIDTFKLDNLIKKRVLNVIEPIYARIASRKKDGKTNYHFHRKDDFIDSIGDQGFDLTHESGGKIPFIVSEIIVFEKRSD